jgi:hypothetical protein
MFEQIRPIEISASDLEYIAAMESSRLTVEDMARRLAVPAMLLRDDSSGGNYSAAVAAMPKRR